MKLVQPYSLPEIALRACWRASGWSAVVLLSLVVGCHHEGPPTASSPAAAPAKEVKPIEADVMAVGLHTWPRIVRTQGNLVADEVTTVGAKVAGRVVEVHVDLGDRLGPGDPLVTLDQSELRLQVDQARSQLTQVMAAVGLQPDDDPSQLNPVNAPPVREAKAVWGESQTLAQRLRSLYERRATSDTELQQAEAAERVAEARYASALNGVHEKLALIGVQKAELGLAEQRLADAVARAPFESLVQSRDVSPGTYVQVGQRLVTLVRTGVVRFRGVIPERYARQLRTGQLVRVHVEGNAEPVETRIARLSPSLDELSRSLTFEADLENTDLRWQAGLFAEAEVILDPTATAVVVPNSAVVQFAGIEKVWKVVDGAAVEQAVVTGRRADGVVEITGGLKDGDRVLLEGSLGRAAPVHARTAPPKADGASEPSRAAASVSPAGPPDGTAVPTAGSPTASSPSSGAAAPARVGS